MKWDVVIVGAGPAGCAAALELARLGFHVLVLERSVLPQPKVCGDLLLGEALRELEGFGLGAAVRSEGRCCDTLRLHAPNGRTVAVPISAVTLGRQRLHALLQERLAAAGVELRQAEVLGPGPGGVGIALRSDGGELPEAICAPLVILASGARYATLEAFGVGVSAAPSAVAVRAYYRDLDGVCADVLEVGFHPPMAPGFGWVFPLPGGICNIGCGRFLRGERPEQFDLPRLLGGFSATFPPAAQIAGDDDLLGVPCSGLLRCGLAGARSHADRLLVAGEAAGTSLPFFGEGIGTALASGRIAAQVAAEALHAGDCSADFLGRFQRQLHDRYGRLCQDLGRVEGWLANPWRLNLLAWQAERHPALRDLLGEVIAHQITPRSALSWAGLLGLARRGN